MTGLLTDLTTLTRTLGDPARDYVIIGEGNTSARIDADTFYIKASGQGMQHITEAGFVAVQFAPALALLEEPALPLAEQKRRLNAAKVDPAVTLQPSVEVTFHALLLTECGVPFIGHTHPVYVNQLLCSSRAQQFAAHRLFPDECVLCGPESVFVPYCDPGLPLAVALRDKVRAYLDVYGEAPKVILLQNHGLIVPGTTPTEVLNVTAMCVKAARIFAGACAVGEPVFMTREDIHHIYQRPDEIYRRQQFVQR
ncbi:MAG: class II aldolase/adducin family protein [Anaerolineae bacterium]|nr:class II aldolase/adducin family protein [Anaerolineae bacterium]